MSEQMIPTKHKVARIYAYVKLELGYKEWAYHLNIKTSSRWNIAYVKIELGYKHEVMQNDTLNNPS